jgi:hypothetical protein
MNTGRGTGSNPNAESLLPGEIVLRGHGAARRGLSVGDDYR